MTFNSIRDMRLVLDILGRIALSRLSILSEICVADELDLKGIARTATFNSIRDMHDLVFKCWHVASPDATGILSILSEICLWRERPYVGGKTSTFNSIRDMRPPQAQLITAVIGWEWWRSFNSIRDMHCTSPL